MRLPIFRNMIVAHSHATRHGFMQEELAAMELSPIFCALDPVERSTIVRTMTAEYWHRGSEICTPRMVASHFRLIVRGRVKVVSSNVHTGREISLQLLGRESTLLLHNLDAGAHEVTIDLPSHSGGGVWFGLLGNQLYDSNDVYSGRLKIDGCGYRWLRESR